MNSETKPPGPEIEEAVIKELEYIMVMLCKVELSMKGRQYIYQRINFYKDRINVKHLQNSSADNRGD
jgi:hypothetical protein